MKSERIVVPGCKGTSIEMLLSENGTQVLKVCVEVGGEIPLHTHNCAATMIITNGKARALGINDRIVTKGDIVVKAPNEPHGFTEVEDPFEFISISDNEGILQAETWNMTF